MATVRLDQKRRALVRDVPASFTKALARYFGNGPTDVELARRQQQAYIEATVSYTHLTLPTNREV